MPLIPIRTETPIRRRPTANIALITVNVVAFILTHGPLGSTLASLSRSMMLLTFEPHLHQFLTYQFLHANLGHLGGNMLFLWVFGNSVNAKLGHGPYILFYLAAGVFAAWGFSLLDPAGGLLIGASGAIAGVTGAYLALFPLSHVMILSLVIVIGFFRVPAMVLIVVKIILWDNMVGPRLSGPDNVAYTAHLSGYAFGFVGGLMMLLSRGVQRDHYDMIAVWERAWRRISYRRALARDYVSGHETGGWVPRRVANEALRDDARFDRVMSLRDDITARIGASDSAGARATHQALLAMDPAQVLPERHQLWIARAYYEAGLAAPAAAAFEQYLQAYRASSEAPGVALLLGILYARDLGRFDRAEAVLSDAMDRLADPTRREQCLRWLEEARRRLPRSHGT